MTHKELALDYFDRKFHCSQAVLAAFKDEIGLTEKQALKLGACFGSGMRKGEVCGACTGIDRLQRSHEPGSQRSHEPGSENQK